MCVVDAPAAEKTAEEKKEDEKKEEAKKVSFHTVALWHESSAKSRGAGRY